MTMDHPGEALDPDRPVLPSAGEYPDGFTIAVHRHHRAQLLYAVRGAMTVSTASGTWVVAPQQAVWVPAAVEHQVNCRGSVSMRTLYVHPRFARDLGRDCRVVGVSALLRELILRMVSLGAQSTDSHANAPQLAGLIPVVLDELRTLESTPLHLPLPGDSRLRLITDHLRAEPADGRSLTQWSQQAGASSRTLARLFVRETGLTFANWRQRLRLQAAVTRLGEGQSVTRVAYDLGYRSPSAFVAMFRRALGAPPLRYFRNGEGDAAG